MSRIVLDTNVLVSGLLNPYGPPGRLLDLVVTGEVQLIFDDRITGEYAAVLLRPRFNFAPALVRNLLDYFRQTWLLVTGLPLGELAAHAPDPDDLAFAEVAVSGKADVLVTGNSKHFGFLEETKGVVQPPAEFLKTLLGESS